METTFTLIQHYNFTSFFCEIYDAERVEIALLVRKTRDGIRIKGRHARSLVESASLFRDKREERRETRFWRAPTPMTITAQQ